ncbi:MAG TPA: trypsin-like peptidase domain-containing protein [Virgibacillus sp.]|nr:trypsin-like peptidase domain-containing protein [Virgibacillus sp.]
MKKKRKWIAPITVTILIIFSGVVAFTLLNNYWKSQDIAIDHTVINKVKQDSPVIDLKTIMHETEKNVVQIEAISEDTSLTGSGFLYNNKGDIITNAHVIKDADVIYVRTANAHIYSAAVVGIGDETDIAVIRVPQLSGQPYLSIETENTPEVGDEVIALGSPHGFQNTVTLGIISGSERNFSVDGFDYENVYQISAQITHGNSGGPLINRKSGKVIGINSVGTEDGTIGFSIPILEVFEQIEQWSHETSNDELKFASTDDIIHQIDSDQLQEDAMYLIDYFFEGIIMRDYVSSYTLLGSQLHSTMSYADFREEYIHIVELTYEEDTSKIVEDSTIKAFVDVSIKSKLPNKETTETESESYEFTIGFENDQLKILDITRSN